TQLLVSRSDEDSISCYLQLIDKCLNHEVSGRPRRRRPPPRPLTPSSFSPSAVLHRDAEEEAVVMETTGPEAVPVHSQESPPGHSRVPNAEEVNKGRTLLLAKLKWLTCAPACSRFGQSNSLPTTGCVGSSVSARRSLRQFQMPSRSLPGARLGPLGSGGLLGPTPRSSSSTPTGLKQGRQGLWFANPGGSNSIPSRTHSSVQRTRSLPVHTTPQTLVMFQQADLPLPPTEPDINNRLESLCLSMTEHALG
ncbi:unnamed protein product, partial [Tetraodon nigroviridis]